MEFADILEQTIALLQHQDGRILVWAGQSSAAPTQVVEPALSPALAVPQGEFSS
jgi:hypothetical protein